MRASVSVSFISTDASGGWEITFDVDTGTCESSASARFGGTLQIEDSNGSTSSEFVNFEGWSAGESGSSSFSIVRAGRAYSGGTVIDVIELQDAEFVCFDTRENKLFSQKSLVLFTPPPSQKKKDSENDYKDLMRKAQYQSNKQFQEVFKKLNIIHQDIRRIASLIEQLPVKIEKIVDEAFQKEVLAQLDAKVGSLSYLWAAVPPVDNIPPELVSPLQLAGDALAYYFERCKDYGPAVYMAAGSAVISAIACYREIAALQPVFLPVLRALRESGLAFFSQLIDEKTPGSFSHALKIQTENFQKEQILIAHLVANKDFVVAHQWSAHTNTARQPPGDQFRLWVSTIAIDGLLFQSEGPLKSPWNWENDQTEHGLNRLIGWEVPPNYFPNLPAPPKGCVPSQLLLEKFYWEIIAGVRKSLAAAQSANELSQILTLHIENITATLAVIKREGA